MCLFIELNIYNGSALSVYLRSEPSIELITNPRIYHEQSITFSPFVSRYIPSTIYNSSNFNRSLWHTPNLIRVEGSGPRASSLFQSYARVIILIQCLSHTPLRRASYRTHPILSRFSQTRSG